MFYYEPIYHKTMSMTNKNNLYLIQTSDNRKKKKKEKEINTLNAS